MGIPKKEYTLFPKIDNTWKLELEEFYQDIIKKEFQIPGILAYKNLEIINSIYKKMIIVRSPLRISIGGGGTDIPSYFKEKRVFISAAINKYVYVTVTRPFEQGIYLKYSRIEKINQINSINHKIIREVLKKN